MQSKIRRALSSLMATALVLSFFAAMPLTAGAADANAIKTAIETHAHGGYGSLTATVSGSTVTVTGNVSSATSILELFLDSDVTVIWKATYAGTAINLINVSGNGTFEVAANGSVTNTGTDTNRSIYSGSADMTINISGGVVVSAGYAIYTTGKGSVINVSGGFVSSSGGISVFMTGMDSQVTVSDGTVTSTGGTPIVVTNTNSQVTVSGGLVSALFDDNGAISVRATGTGATVDVSGGLVFSYDGDDSGAIRMQNGGAPTIGGDAVVCAWIKPAAPTEYDEDSSDDLTVDPAGATAVWGFSGSATGIYYENGANTGFLRIDDAAIYEAVSGTHGPFQVTEHPLGATYYLNDDAELISATFEYGSGTWLGGIDSGTPIIARWYWSDDNSNTDRTNGFAESTVEYDRSIKYTTTHKPATDTVGVRYYYAVLSYAEGIGNSVEPREAVSNPARIEVIDPDKNGNNNGNNNNGQTGDNNTPNLSFEVRKTDGGGNLLSGAVLALVPDSSYEQDPSVIPHEATTVNGFASFTLTPGYYILSEKQAPAGYNATDDKYNIVITESGVYFGQTTPLVPYSTVTFVNKEIPALDKVNHNFAYMQGYPEGDFRPSNNMTRAEAVVMFSRLLERSMNLDEDHRYNCYPDVPYATPWLGADTVPWYANQVCYMNDIGVLADFSRDGRFRPGDPVTRAEFATLATHFEELTLTDTNIFPDVPSDHWAVKYINSAAARGWILGYPDSTFRPDNYITRAEVVALVNRVLERTGDGDFLIANAGSLPRSYWDITDGHWAYLDIMEASIGHYYIVDGIEKWVSFS